VKKHNLKMQILAHQNKIKIGSLLVKLGTKQVSEIMKNDLKFTIHILSSKLILFNYPHYSFFSFY
jgi:hypothetical protein